MKLYLCSALALMATANAILVPTAPATEWDATEANIVKWMDDGEEPKLSQTSDISIQLFTGSTYQQSFLQDLTSGKVLNGRRTELSVRIDPDVGPSGQYYFLRFRTPDLSTDVFSAKFTLENMTGKFNATIEAQLEASGSIAAAPDAALPASSGSVRTADNKLDAASSATITGSRLPSSTPVTREGIVDSSASTARASGLLLGVLAVVFALWA